MTRSAAGAAGNFIFFETLRLEVFFFLAETTAALRGAGLAEAADTPQVATKEAIRSQRVKFFIIKLDARAPHSGAWGVLVHGAIIHQVGVRTH